MTLEKTLEFLNKGGLLAGAIITCAYAFVKIDRLETKTDTLQAVVIDCYKERVNDMAIKGNIITQKPIKRNEFYAVLPNEFKIKKDEKEGIQ